jgi:protocatechuate 3,4-dioxygenase beta subunit
MGTVTGRVIEAHSGDPAKPIQKALVILRQRQETGTATYSDDKGNHRLQMEPGVYSVTVERDGYVTAPQSKATTVTAQAGQTAVDVILEMVRTGAISGRIVDSDGTPLARATVQLYSVRQNRGGVALGGATDDRGEYRFFQIPPGKYNLSATYQPSFQQREIKLQTPDGTAGESYATTYFPGTPDPARATVLEVPAGADLAGVDLQLQRVHAVRIRGRVSGMAAAPLSIVMVGLQPVTPGFGAVRHTVVRDPTGEFEFAGVLPGRYVLSANAPDLTNRESGPAAQRDLEIGPTDLDGIQLILAPPQTLSGLVVVPEHRKVPQGLLVALSNHARTNHQGGGLARVASDGTFTLPAVPAGEYEIELASAGPGDDLYVSGIRRGDDDLIANGLRVDAASVDPIQIVLKPNGGTVEVVVRHTYRRAASRRQRRVAARPATP